MAFYLNPGFINVSKKNEFRQMLKFVELRKTCVLTVLKISYKPALLQLREVVITYLSATKKAWKISNKVMKIVYCRSTYFLSVLIIGLT